MRARAAVATALVALGATAGARADEDPPRGLIPRIVRATLDSYASITAKPPVSLLRAPTPHPVTWKAAKLGSLELGAPLLGLASADLAGDGTTELYAVTTRAVVVIAVTATGRVSEAARYPFTGPVAVPQPRDPVGAIYVEGGEVVASASPWMDELRVGATGPLGSRTGVMPTGLGLCATERRPLVAGRNYFEDNGAPLFAVVCNHTVVDHDGTPLHVRAALGDKGKLAVTAQRCRGTTCEPAKTFDYAGVGTAFAVDDVDTDGTPEVIIAGAGAPGDADAVKVIVLGGDAKKGVYRKVFQGGVAAITTMPGLTSGRTVVAAVRLAGATRVDLWRLD